MRPRPLRRSAALLAALALGGCAYATTGHQPVAGSAIVDDGYAVVRQAWNTGDVFHYAFALRPLNDRAILCGSVGREPSGGLRGVLDDRVARGLAVLRDGQVVASGLGFFAGPFEGQELRGRPARCIATDLPWSPDMADPSRLRMRGGGLVFL